MRGVDFVGWFNEEEGVGSPPHAWGRFNRSMVFLDGFAVHPHMRGVDARIITIFSVTLGSPPHAWGRFSIIAVD